jgi:hypothetical protein
MNSYEVTDNITPFMIKLSILSRGLGNQALNKAGAKIQSTMRNKAKNFGSHKGGVGFTKDGYQKIDYSRDKKTYSRESTKTGRYLKTDMGDLIRFKLYEHSSVLLAGWINTRSFTSLNFRGGVASNGKRVKGTKTKAIADRMARGGRITIAEQAKLGGISVKEQLLIHKRSGWGNVKATDTILRKRYRFMSFSHYLSTAESVAKKEFILAINQFKKVA